MDTYSGAVLLLGILVLVLMIGVLRSRAEWLLNLALRGVSGMLIIYFANFFLADAVPAMQLGYNPITFLTSGILGFPGVLMLYGINFYMLM